MKKLLWIFSSALLLSSVFLNTGCKDDEALDPLIQITDEPDAIFIGGGQIASFTISVTKGTDPLKSLTIKEDGTVIDASRITISGITTANNPQLVTGADTEGFTWDIDIEVHDAFDTRTYSFEVEDDGGRTDAATFDIEVQEGIEQTLSGVLWNQAGPVGRGGIDLDDGSSTGTGPHVNDPADTYLDAEVRDMGIDSTAGTGDNWRRRIGPINDTEIRFLGNGTPEGFDFDKVGTKAAIEAAFDSADSFTETLSTWPSSFKVSHEVQVGDIFVVRKDTEYYLVRVDDISETTALGNNEDNYEVSIKY